MTTELYEILELYCELLLARAGLLEGPNMDPGLEEAILSIIYATPRVEVKELTTVRALLFEKYGREWATRATDDIDGNVSERVKRKLRVEPPGHELVDSYLKAIATTYDIPYGEGQAQDNDNGDDAGTGGGQGEAELATKEPQESDKEPPLPTSALQDMSTPPPKEPGTKSPVSIVPPSPSTDNTNPKIKFPGPPDLKPGPKMAKAQQPDKQDADADKAPGKNVNGNRPAGKVPDIDDLEARFARLKR